MAINVSQAFKRTSIAPIDETMALTKAQMLTVQDNLMPAYYFTICQDDGKIYLYDKTATASPTTGKFTEFSGGSGTGGSEVFLTTATLDTDINDTTTVLAADLSGVSFSDITVGVTIIRDAKGTMGVVTAKNGTTDVTVTTATTSTPTRELTQAQYDALTEAEKNNGTIYFITDDFPGGTYVGAYETIYSTTERVIGSYLGKPLYQKVVDCGQIPSGVLSDVSMSTGISSVEHYHLIAVFGSNAASTQIPYMTGTSDHGSNLCYMSYMENNIPVIRLWSSYDRSGFGHLMAIIQYTKTTDTTAPVEYATPNDYSTSEKIVGTWIDGKPLYQKTFTGQLIGDSDAWSDLSGVIINNADYITVKKADFVAIGTDYDGAYPMPYGANVVHKIVNGQYKIYIAGSNWMSNHSTYHVTLEYTKTTD